ncbi:dipeptidase [candidate division KSB1 bacterium]|nr:dipeptidase [candidate division KSB1 bacterium]
MLRTKLIVMLSILVLGCQQKSPAPEGYDPGIYEQALKIAQSTIILDGHVDVPYRLVEQQKMDDISQATVIGDFDYPRAKQGGLDVPFMSIYIPADYQKEAGASKKHAEKLIAMMDSIVTTNWDKFAPAITPDDVKRNFEKGLISFPYGMENGSAIEDDLSNVEYFYKKGVRYITLTHGKKNLICDSSFDPDNKDWNGLSPFGRKVVAEMNRLGIMIDLSHVSDSTFYQVLRQSKVPPICSHSSCRHFTPGMERNVGDNMLKALGEKGGVIQINFSSYFLTKLAYEKGGTMWGHRSKFMSDNSITDGNHPKLLEEMKKYNQANPFPYSSLDDVVDHIDHVVKVAGIDHVGLGSDFDGVGDTLPAGLKSVADYPNLIYHLLKRGYTEADIKKILSGNVLRVWQEVVDYTKS